MRYFNTLKSFLKYRNAILMLPKQNTMAAKSKEEYLKRYISGADADDKKKKKKKKEKIAKLKNKSNVRIVDDDVDFQSLLPSNLKNTLDEDIGDDDPIVAEFVDERPDVVKHLEQYRKNTKWKTLESDEESSRDKHGQSSRSHRRHDSDSDQSLEQSTQHDSDSNFSRIRSRSPGFDSSPLRENRHDSDQSPPRRKRHDSDSDQSPPRRKRHDSDPDQSPPRKTRRDSDSDQSPPRRKRHDSDSDQSPPRKKRHDSDSDQSPPRRKRHDSDSDQSPPRISRKGRNSHSDQSPSRRGQARSESDHLSSRIKREHSTRHSPNRNKHTKAPNEVNLKIRTEVDERGRAKQTLGGAKAGLQSARDMKEEARKLRSKEDLAFSQMDADLLGKDARTVFRDKKSGKKRNMKAEAEEERQKQEKQAEKEAKYQKWGKGLKQAEQQQVSLDQAVHEASKPLARYKDDQDLDSLLRDQDREGDPMLAFIKKKKSKTASGQERPVYKGPEPPPNRFKLRPGYRWDGVDRSNGFERQFFAKKSEKNAIKDIAYKWSVEDM